LAIIIYLYRQSDIYYFFIFMDFISLFFTKKISGLHCPDFNVCVECEVILVDRKVEKSVVMHDAIEHVFRLHMGDEKKEEEEGERKE